MKWSVSTPPADSPVSWTEAKAHLRLDGDTEEGYVQSLIDAATDDAMEAMACSLVEQEITAVYYAGEPIHLPRGPVIAVESVTDATDKTIAAFDLERVGRSDRLKLRESYTAPLTVVYSAGYGNPDQVPPSLRLGILCHVATLYENRESVTDKQRLAVPHQMEAFYRRRRRDTGIG